MPIYIGSTLPSCVVARPASHLLQAARQQLTKDWRDLMRSNHDLFTSQVAIGEIASGEPAMAEQRLRLMNQIKLPELTDDANALTKEIRISFREDQDYDYN